MFNFLLAIAKNTVLNRITQCNISGCFLSHGNSATVLSHNFSTIIQSHNYSIIYGSHTHTHTISQY